MSIPFNQSILMTDANAKILFGDLDTYFYESSDDVLDVVISGSLQSRFGIGYFYTTGIKNLSDADLSIDVSAYSSRYISMYGGSSGGVYMSGGQISFANTLRYLTGSYDFLYYGGDGIHNYFRTSYTGGVRWDYSWGYPYG